MDSQVYLGSVAFGTETFFAYNETIFSANDYVLNITSNATGSSSATKKSAGDRTPRVGYGLSLGLLVLAFTALVC